MGDCDKPCKALWVVCWRYRNARTFTIYSHCVAFLWINSWKDESDNQIHFPVFLSINIPSMVYVVECDTQRYTVFGWLVFLEFAFLLCVAVRSFTHWITCNAILVELPHLLKSLHHVWTFELSMGQTKLQKNIFLHQPTLESMQTGYICSGFEICVRDICLPPNTMDVFIISNQDWDIKWHIAITCYLYWNVEM